MQLSHTAAVIKHNTGPRHRMHHAVCINVLHCQVAVCKLQIRILNHPFTCPAPAEQGHMGVRRTVTYWLRTLAT